MYTLSSPRGHSLQNGKSVDQSSANMVFTRKEKAKMKAQVDERSRELSEEIRGKQEASFHLMNKAEIINPKFNQIRTATFANTTELRKRKVLQQEWHNKAKSLILKDREIYDKKDSLDSDDEHEIERNDQDKIYEFVHILLTKPMYKKKNDKTKTNKTKKELDITNMPILKLTKQTINME